MNKANERIEETSEPLFYVVDKNTGEITQSLFAGDRIVQSKYDEYNEKYYSNFNKGEIFVKAYINPLLSLNPYLTTREKAVLFEIIPLISYKDGILRHNNQILDLKEMCELLHEEYSGFRRVIKSLIDKEILKKIDVTSDTSKYKTQKAYVVNPYIFFKGTDLQRNVMLLFADSKWANLNESE